MKQYITIDNEPNFHIIIIASVVLHILFIALAAVPTRTKERDVKNYFVNLVTPTEIQKTPKATLSKKPSVNVKETEKTKTEKVHKKQEVQLNKAKPRESKNIKKTRGDQISSLPKLRPKSEKVKMPSKRGFEIKRNFQKPKTAYNQDTVTIDKGHRGPTFATKEVSHDKQIMIARNNKPVLRETVPIDKGHRGPAFGVKEDSQKQQIMIARNNKPSQTQTVPIDKGYRNPTPASKEGPQKQHFMIERKNRPAETETPEEPGNSELYSNSESDLKRHVEFNSAVYKEDSAIIKKPGSSGEAKEREIDYQRQTQQIINNADLKREKENFDNNELSSEFSIQGVQLDDLMACTNALDERTLKKKILKIVGVNKGCYSPTTGKYVFLGTGRFTSFDMMILPVSGRELSNRCEELKNALFCLNSLKE